MSGQPEVAAAPPTSGSRQEPHLRRPRERLSATSSSSSASSGPPAATEATSSSPAPAQVRDVVRLFQCGICSAPVKDPVALPCGRTLCRSCLPTPFDRRNITYPTGPERSRGIDCPFGECPKEHAIVDCSSDVVLNKLVDFLRDAIARETQEARNAGVSTSIRAVPVGQQEDNESTFTLIQGGQLVATWTLAEQGRLRFDQDVEYGNTEPTPSDEAFSRSSAEVLRKLRNDTRSEMDCQVCYGLFCDPLTTACGHTFCRSCLQRILDHSQYCAICRRKLPMNPMLNHMACPSNQRLTQMIDTFWPDELASRKETMAAEYQLGRDSEYDISLFVCTMAFPMMPTFLHVFEPRYRLLIRRALDADRTFGMVLPRRQRQASDLHFYEYGTLLRITNAHFYPDGRSLIETRGVSRFKVTGHGVLDGYTVGKIERIDDVSIEEEEETERQEAMARELNKQHQHENQQPQQDQDGHGVASPLTPPPERNANANQQDEHSYDQNGEGQEEQENRSQSTLTMSTRGLLDFALDFVSRMQERGVPWLSEHMIDIYGECPTDAALLPWWLASMLPVRDDEKYRLLGTSSVRARLKICYAWIVEWESSPWWVAFPRI